VGDWPLSYNTRWRSEQLFYEPIVKEALSVAQSIRSSMFILQLLVYGVKHKRYRQASHARSAACQHYITILCRKANCLERSQLVDWYQQMNSSGGNLRQEKRESMRTRMSSKPLRFAYSVARTRYARKLLHDGGGAAATIAVLYP
jgi:hypothetical protein